MPISRTHPFLSSCMKFVIAVAACFLLVLMGLKRAIPKYNSPADYRIRIVSSMTGAYSIQVRGADGITHTVAQDNYVELHVPRLPRGVCWDLYCWTLVDESPDNLPSIIVMRNGNAVKSLSLRQLKAMPVDENGSILLKL